jgi:hypothetical protein
MDPGAGDETFSVELGIDDIGVGVPRMLLAPDRQEPPVVGAPAERTGTMSGRERGGLVREEELREASGLHQRLSMPAAEPEATDDPASAVVVQADPAVRVVQAAPVAVDEAASRIGDQLAERRDPVLERHGGITIAASVGGRRPELDPA